MSAPSKITTSCKRYILRIVIILCGLVLFHTTINKLFNKILKLLPIEFGRGYVDITLGILTLLGAVFIPLKWLERYKNQLLVVWGFGVFLHLLDTFYWKEWSYTSMSVSMISYVVFFLYVFPFVFVVKGTVEKAHYLQKEEIKEEKLNDSFGYNTHAKKLLEFIKNRKGRDSYAIGINAKWGEGKSFFIDLFKEELVNSKSDKELIVVDFKPWFSHSPLDIINDFFTVFGERLEEEGIYIQSDLEKYKEALMGVETEEALLNQLLKSVKGLFDNDSKSSSLLYERINNVLKEENRRIIVVIDDLDRLTKEELFEVIKLVRNSGSLKNTFFVLAYDRTYLEEALDSLQIGKHDKYLEKVIQLELTLPIIISENYENYATEYVLREYNDYSEQWNLAVLFIEKEFEIFNNDLCNIRYVEYFIDKLIYEFTDVKGEIEFTDFFVLYLMKEERVFDFSEFAKIAMSINNDISILETFFENKNSRLTTMFSCLRKNEFVSDSFLGNKNRRALYLKAFLPVLQFIPNDKYISFITSADEESCRNTISELEENFYWKNDFIKRLNSITRISEEHFNKDVGENIIKIYNTILKDNKEFKDEYFRDKLSRLYSFYQFVFNLKDKFGLSVDEIKEKIFDIDYPCEVRARMFGLVLMGLGGAVKVESFEGILSKKDILDINTNFLRLALLDENLTAKEKMGFFWQLQLPNDNDKEYVFHNAAKELMFNYIANHVNDFEDIILEKEVHYKFYTLFGEFDDFITWIKENELNNNDVIKRYLRKYLNQTMLATHRELT